MNSTLIEREHEWLVIPRQELVVKIYTIRYDYDLHSWMIRSLILSDICRISDLTPTEIEIILM